MMQPKLTSSTNTKRGTGANGGPALLVDISLLAFRLAGYARSAAPHGPVIMSAINASYAAHRQRPSDFCVGLVLHHGHRLSRRPMDRNWGGRKNSRADRSCCNRDKSSHDVAPGFYPATAWRF